MMNLSLFVILLALLLQSVHPFTLPLRSCGSDGRLATAITMTKEDPIKKYTNEKVDKGLTHIKYNKYAPSSEEAKDMSDEEFRDTIKKRMKDAEEERKKGGEVGNACSDNYLSSLGGTPPPPKKSAFSYKKPVESENGAVFMVTSAIPTMSADNYLEAMNWRYATKKFDTSKKIPEDIMSALEESLRLTPSSFGLQPWKFLIIENTETREKLREASYKQGQITDSSALVVLLNKKTMGEKDVDAFFDLMVKTQNSDMEKLEGYKKTILNFLSYKDEIGIKVWAQNQVYIALGQLMTTCAVLGIDACPLEGIIQSKYDEILSLADTDYETCVVCAVGYRADECYMGKLPKVRNTLESVVERLK